MVVAQYMLPSPIRLKTVSTPSLAKALASISYIGKLLIRVSSFPGKSGRRSCHGLHQRSDIGGVLDRPQSARQLVGAGCAEHRLDQGVELGLQPLIVERHQA